MSEISSGGASGAGGTTASTTNASGEHNAAKETTVQPTAAEIRKFKVKIDGLEQEVPEDELIRGYQTRKAADKTFREGAAARKQAEEFIKLMKTDPIKVLKDPRIGHDVRKLAEEYLVSQLNEDMMDPKDRELRDTKAKLKEFEDMTTKQKEMEEQKRAEALTKKHSESYTKDIVTALESSGLPKTEHTVKRMAYYMHQSLKMGTPMTAIEVTSLVKEDYIAEHKALHSGLDGDTLISILGDEAANKLRKWDVSRLKGGDKRGTTPADQKITERDPKSKGMSPLEFRKYIMSKNS